MDFGVELPWQTQVMLRVSDVAVDYWWAFFPAVFLLLLLPVWIPAMPWFVPGLGVVQRRYLQSHVLDMLAHLLSIGRTVPQALGLIASMPLEERAIGRLAQAQHSVEQGQQFADSLCAAGLLPRSMVPLLHAAERAGNLPWILAELADSLFKRTARTLHRVMQFVFPTTVVAVGAVVGIVVFSLFIPLIQLISELSLWDRPI
jgi:type II secretory pathway component PulF